MGWLLATDKKMADVVSDAIKTLSDKLRYIQEFKLQVNREHFFVEFTLIINSEGVGHFKLVEMPGCCGVLISTQTWVDKKYQGQGLAQEMMFLKEAIAEKFGYTLLFATVRLDNKAEIHILEKFGWQQNSSFTNKRTGNNIAVFTKNLYPEKVKQDDKEK